MAIAGSVAPVFRDGGYDATATYDFYHALIHNNRLCFCRQDGTIGHEPQEESDEYWFISLDGNIADASTLNGKTEEELSVGNALKLNGLTAEEFVKGTSDFFASGETVLSWVLNPKGVNSKVSLYYVVMPSDGIEGEAFYTLEHSANGVIKVIAETIDGTSKRYKRIAVNGAWYANWTDTRDGGNAETVDGFHASEILTAKDGELSDLNAFLTRNYFMNATYGSAANLPPSGLTSYAKVVNIGVADSAFTQFYIPINDTGAGKIQCRYYESWGNPQWGSWISLATTADLANYLPLDGSVPMSGQQIGLYGGYGVVGASDRNAHLVSRIGNTSTSARRALYVRNQNESAHMNDALTFSEIDADGTVTSKTVLHTGNSQKVVTSDSAPSDTSALWYDTTNKILKRYVDGAWQA